MLKWTHCAVSKDTRTVALQQAKVYGHEDIMAHLLDAGDEETGTKYSGDELLGEGVMSSYAHHTII